MSIVISKLLICFFSHIHTRKYRNSAFTLRILFFIILVLLQDFLLSQTHIARIFYWFSKIQDSTSNSVNGVLRLPGTPQNDMKVFKSLISSFVYIITVKTIFNKKDIYKQNWYLSPPHNNYPRNLYNWKIWILPKNFICFE